LGRIFQAPPVTPGGLQPLLQAFGHPLMLTTLLPRLGPLRLPILAMALVILLSNILVQHPINDWLTWGAFSYPLVFLVSDLSNRSLGPVAARRVAWVGFAVAVLLSLILAPWRIAVASGLAFLISQFLDISVFNRWRAQSWWKAPLMGSLVASVVDTGVFFFLAFAGTDMDWLLLALGDVAVKAAMAAVLLAPYKLLLPYLGAWMAAPAQPAS
jgi:queuosine precursor transporter